MLQIFVTLQHLLKDQKVETFIKHFDDRRIFQYGDYFLLDQERIQRLFKTNLTALQSEITLSEDYFDEQTTKVVAMTIDGDFILANDQRTYVVPRTLVKADLEVYEMPVIDFFVAYETHELNSNIIPSAPVLPENPSEEQEILAPAQADEEKDERPSFFSRFFKK